MHNSVAQQLRLAANLMHSADTCSAIAVICIEMGSVNRKLHFAGTSIVLVLLLLNPRSLPAMGFAACVGYALCPLLVGMDHGLIELVVMMLVFLGVHKLSVGKIGVGGLIPIVGYALRVCSSAAGNAQWCALLDIRSFAQLLR